MRRALLERCKELLTRIGARLSSPALHRVQMVVNYLRVGRWMRAQGFAPGRRVANRAAVFAAVAARVSDGPVLYLEFGVYRGESLRFWSRALRHPDARLHGFDSFRGLPEDFDVGGPYARGTFDVGGAAPQIADPRVRFFPGRFEQSLASYQPPAHEALVVLLDADLYSSTLLVLRQLRPHLAPGTIVILGDLSRPDHEPRAFQEFLAESRLRFRVVAASYSLNIAAFECVTDS